MEPRSPSHKRPRCDPSRMLVFVFHPSYISQNYRQFNKRYLWFPRLSRFNELYTAQTWYLRGFFWHLNTLALQYYLNSLKPHQKASTVKLLHDWSPTYSTLCRQGRECSPLYPRCLYTVETPPHVKECPDLDASKKCQLLLHSFLLDLERLSTAPSIITVLESKLSIVLNLQYVPINPCKDEVPQT